MARHHFLCFWSIASIAVIVLGCGHSGVATVSGDVTYEGEPVMDGMITFIPADGKGPVVGGRIVDGTYSVENVAPGTKLVKVEAVKAVPFARSSEEMARRAEENRTKGDGSGLIDPADVIPADADGNNRSVEIRAGTNEVMITLKKSKRSR